MRAVAAGSSRQGKGKAPTGSKPASVAARGPGRHAAALATRIHPAPPRIALQRKKGAPFYDEIQKKIGTLSAGHRSLGPLNDLLALSQLVHAGSTAGVPAAVTTFLASGNGMGELEFPSTQFSDALVTRVFLIGLPDESRRLRAFFVSAERRGPFQRGEYTPELRLWRQIVAGVLGRAKRGSAAEASAAIEDIVVTARELGKVLGALDPKAVASSVRLDTNEPFNEERYWDTQFGGSWHGWTRLAGYFFGLRGLQEKLYTSAQMAFQTLMDVAIADHEGGRGAASLEVANRVLETQIAALVTTSDALPDSKDWYPPPSAPGRMLASSEQPVDVTRSTFAGRPGGAGKHQDVFGATRKHAPVSFYLYDVTKGWGSEKGLSIRRMFEIRRHQISLLRRLHASVGPTGKFELHGNDAWRELLLKELIAQETAGKDETAQLTHVVRLLEEYLASFTIMSPNDIDDFGDNYLTRTFPRALTGQLIHDCGVYALRIAYALSLVRDRLGLEFRFVRLPSHLALTLSGPRINGAFVFNNNQVFPIGKDAHREMRKAWDAQAGGMTKKASDDAFWGHVTAGTYVERVDIPFRTFDVPSEKSGRALKSELWSSFRTATKFEPIGLTTNPAHDQFNLKYLSIIDDRKALRNNFSSAIFTLWQSYGPGLLDLSRGGVGPKYRKAAAAYRVALDNVRAARQKAEAKFAPRGAEIDAMLRQDPKLVAPGATKAQWSILDPHQPWEKELDDYLRQVDAGKPEPDFRFHFRTTD